MITRRSFLGYCIASAAALKLSPLDLFNLRAALANPNGATLIWIHGSGCSGCSVSFLNRVPQDTDATFGIPAVNVAELLTGSASGASIPSVNLVYHSTLMAAAGDTAVSAVTAASASGNYILVVEGGVSTAFGGACSSPWYQDGKDVPFQHVVGDLAQRAKSVLAVGTCAAFGGVTASGPNLSKVIGVSSALSLSSVVNISGCPPHPDWIVWALAIMLANNGIWPSGQALDSHSRPLALYGNEIHARCPRNSLNTPGTPHAATFGVDNQCLIKLGCNGPGTYSPCPAMKWNSASNWCIDANSNCLGCVEPTFPNARGNPDFYAVPTST